MTDDPKPSTDGAVDSAEPSPKPAMENSERTFSIKIGSQREDSSGPPAPPEADLPIEATASESARDEHGEPTTAESPTIPDAAAGNQSPAVEPEVASDVEAPPSISSEPPPRVTGMPDELAAEIDDALGGMSLDALMDGSASGGQASTEVELDQRYRATVIKTDRESVFFSLGGQYQGVASLKQFVEVVPEPGTELEVVPTRFVTDDNLYELVIPGASVEVQDWSDLSEGVVVEAKITGHNKGGLECEVNRIRGFIPVSQVALFRVEDLEPYIGQALQCVVTEANPDRRNLVLSHRAVLERERAEAREKLLSELEVGQTREGVVRRVLDFGAFVDLGGVDGMVHVSQLSWDRIAHPSEVVEEGQTIKVRIEKIDPNTGKIGLSYRELLDHPWQSADAKFPVGAIVEGTVSKIMQFGAFVRIAPGIEGLVHISELAHHRVQRVNSVVKEGEPIHVKILAVDPAAQKMSLSLKAVTALAEPESVASEEEAEDSEPATTAKPKSNRPLKGGLNRGSGGDQFGLNW